MENSIFGRATAGIEVIHKIEELRVDRKDKVSVYQPRLSR